MTDQTPEVVHVDSNARGPLGGGWGSGCGIAHLDGLLWSSEGQAPALWDDKEAAAQNAAYCAHLYPHRVKSQHR